MRQKINRKCCHTTSVRTKRVKERNKQINQDRKVERHATPERHVSTQPKQLYFC